MTIIHRFRSGGYIARNGAAVEVCVGPGAGGMPLIVVFEGEALAALATAAAAAAAFRERSGAWKDLPTGREKGARRWKEGGGRG